MRNLTFHRLLQILIVSVFVAVTAQNSIADDSLEAQVADILSEEAAKGKIKVGISDFSVSTNNRDVSPSDIENLKTQAKEEFMGGLLQNLKAKGIKDKVSLISEGAPDADIKILGSIRITENEAVYSAKVVKAKGGEVLGIAKQREDLSGGILGQIVSGVVEGIMRSDEEAPAPAPSDAPQELVNESFTVQAGTFKPYGWEFPTGTILEISFSASHDINVFVVDELNLVRYEAGKEFSALARKEQVKSANFKASIPKEGKYYVVVSNRAALLMSAEVSLYIAHR